MEIWKTYRWTLVGGILIAVFLIPAISHLASLTFMPSTPKVSSAIVVLSISLVIISLVLIGKNSSQSSPANNRFQAVLFGGFGAIISSLLAYCFLISPTAGAYAVHTVLPNGIHPITDEFLHAEKSLEILASVIWYSTLFLGVVMLSGAILGGLGGYMTKLSTYNKKIPSMDILPFSIIGLIYAAPISSFPTAFFFVISLVSESKSNTVPINNFEIAITFQALILFAWFLFWQIANLRYLNLAIKYYNKQGISWAISGLVNFLSALFQIRAFWYTWDFYRDRIPISSLFVIVYIIFILLSLSIGSLALLTSRKIYRLPRSNLLFSLRSIKKYLLDAATLGMFGVVLLGAAPILNFHILALNVVISLLPEFCCDFTLVSLIQYNFLFHIVFLLCIFIMSYFLFKTTDISFRNLFNYIVRFRKEVLTVMQKREET